MSAGLTFFARRGLVVAAPGALFASLAGASELVAPRCNPREENVPCVSGTFNRARDHARGTLRFGKHGRWTWSASAVGTVSGGGG